MKRSAFKQGALTGLCGPYAITNAFSQLYPGWLSATEATLLARRLAGALACDFRTVLREGTDRGQMVSMLDAVRLWTAGQGWPAWSYTPLHPAAGTKANTLWDGLSQKLASSGTAAIVGFGDHDRPNTRYEPHWTCVDRIGPRTVHLLDSDEYERVPRSATGVRPEAGWEIEDCFILMRDGVRNSPIPHDLFASPPSCGIGIGEPAPLELIGRCARRSDATAHDPTRPL
jgi:hypothetical protein